MSMSMKPKFYFLLIFVLFIETKSQMLEAKKAVSGKLKHLVFLKVEFGCDTRQGTWPQYGAGTIINMKWVLTAAHVVEDYSEIERGNTIEYFRKKVRLTAGTKDLRDANLRQRRLIERDNVYVHKDYERQPSIDDVALIYLKKPLDDSNTIEPANLLTSGMHFVDGVKCVVSGWGKNGYTIGENGKTTYIRDSPNYARQGIMELLNGEKCKIYDGYESELQFCYGCNEGTCPSAAPGDSGAPVVCALEEDQDPVKYGYVFAIHSFGCADVKERCTPDGPSVGTDVRGITEWMNKKIKQVEEKLKKKIYKKNKIIKDAGTSIHKMNKEIKEVETSIYNQRIIEYAITAAIIIIVYWYFYM